MADFEPLRNRITEAEQKEDSTLSPIWGGKPLRRLYEKDSIALRKEVYNIVIADAFGPFGFVERRRKRGLDILYKPLTDKYAMVVEVDPIAFLRAEFRDTGSWRTISLNPAIYLLSADRRGGEADVVFFHGMGTPFSNYATNRCRGYHDTRSLEVAIRALALNYEVLVEPFAAIIRQHG